MLSSATSGSGTSSQSQASVANVSLLGGLVAADLVKSNSSATCNNGQAAVTGNSQLVDLVAAGQPVLASNPNLAISLPGGISVIIETREMVGGRGRDRTGDPLLAKQMLSQLSYTPTLTL